MKAALAAEPETLIFASHEVVGAPTQRIFYQLFRDEAAFAAHRRQPHLQRFLAESRTHVIATNVIELKLGAAKVPLPAPEFPGGDMPAQIMITLLGKPGCHLCEDARAVIERVARDLDVPWEERDITTSERDTEQYWEQIPVTLINGVQHDFWRVDEARLRAAIAKLR